MKLLKNDIIKALKTVYDPEIPISIWDLGLVYDISINPGKIVIKMTFTSPICPLMNEIINEIKSAVQMVSSRKVCVELVWDPPWDISKMSDSAKLELDSMK